MARLRVLIVDDERTILFTLVRTLPGAWTITAEPSAEAALKRFEAGETFDVILLDLMIPHVSGMVLFAEIQQKWPAMSGNVIFMTGGLYIPAVRVFLDALPGHIVLEKPFLLAEVVDAVLKLQEKKKHTNGTSPPDA